MSNGQVTILDSDSDSHSDGEATRSVAFRGSLGLSAPDSLGTGAPLASCRTTPQTGVGKAQHSNNSQDNDHSAILHCLQHGVWKLNDTQIRIDLGSSILLQADFLKGLENLSKISKVTWEEALAMLKQVHKERKDGEKNRCVNSKLWVCADTVVALERILDRSQPKHAERTQRKKQLEHISSPHSSLVSPLEPPSRAEVRSTTPTGDPPSTWRSIGSFTRSVTIIADEASKDKGKNSGQRVRYTDTSTAQPGSQKIMVTSVSARGPVTTEKREAASNTSSTSDAAHEAARAFLRDLKSSRTKKASESLPLKSQTKAAEVISLEYDESDDSGDMAPGWSKEVKAVLGELIDAESIRTIRAAGVILEVRQAIKIRSMIKGDLSSKHRLTKSKLEQCLGLVECQDHKTGKAIYYDDNWIRIAEGVDFPRAGPAGLKVTPTATPALHGTAHSASESLGTSHPPETHSITTQADKWGVHNATKASDLSLLALTSTLATAQGSKKDGAVGNRSEAEVVSPTRIAPLAMGVGDIIPVAAVANTSVVADAPLSTPTTSLKNSSDVSVVADLHAVAAAQVMPSFTNANNKRNADAAGIFSNEGSSSRRQKTNARQIPTSAEVIDLLDSDDEKFVAKIPEGSKRKPIVCD